MSEQYKAAGVDLEAGYKSVELIKKHIKRTNRLGVFNAIGSFGGMFDLSSLNMKNPVLVSGTDGVGTKLKLAFALDKHDTIGQDLVAMCVNDVLAQGASPLFFLDYIATSANVPEKIEQIVKGIADGCVLANAALIGGETAEMPSMYSDGEYDLAGFCVGAVEKEKIIDATKVKVNDVIIGLSSSGVHSNGFSLVRKIIDDHKLDINNCVEGLKNSLGETLLTPTKIYVKPVLAVLKKIDVHGIAHITGGGFYENIPRALNENQAAMIDGNSFEVLPIFNYLQKLANIETKEMFNVFNMGIGMILIVDQNDVEQTLEILKQNNEPGMIIGKVISGSGVIIQ